MNMRGGKNALGWKIREPLTEAPAFEIRVENCRIWEMRISELKKVWAAFQMNREGIRLGKSPGNYCSKS